KSPTCIRPPLQGSIPQTGRFRQCPQAEGFVFPHARLAAAPRGPRTGELLGIKIRFDTPGFRGILYHMRQYTSYWALLLGNPLFEGMEEATVRALVGNENGPRAFGREETLFGPESERGLAFLLSGSALVYKEQADG